MSVCAKYYGVNKQGREQDVLRWWHGVVGVGRRDRLCFGWLGKAALGRQI